MASAKSNGIHEFNLHDLFQFPCTFQKVCNICHPQLRLQFFCDMR